MLQLISFYKTFLVREMITIMKKDEVCVDFHERKFPKLQIFYQT